jgi:pimeloyl-ACP methyl ester carboxylesterase
MTCYVEGWGAIPAGLRSRLLANDAEALAASRIGSSRAPSFAETVANLSIPMLVFAGGNDQPTHDQAQHAAIGNPQVRFVSLPGYGHANVASAAIVPHLRAFLAEVYGPASTPA